MESFKESAPKNTPEQGVKNLIETVQNQEAALVEQYFALQLEITELNKVLNASVDDALNPENAGKKNVYTAVGRRFHKMIEEINKEKEEIGEAIKLKGLDPKEYTLQ